MPYSHRGQIFYCGFGLASCAVFSLHALGVHRRGASLGNLAQEPEQLPLQCNHATWVLSARAGREPFADRHAGGSGRLPYNALVAAQVAAQSAAAAAQCGWSWLAD